MKTDTPRVFMKDVARKAELSVSTVSLALKGHPALKNETVNRVKQIALEMGYIPDPALSALSSYRCKKSSRNPDKVIAFVTNNQSEFENGTDACKQIILDSAKERAKLLGYKLEAFFVSENGINSNRLDGILKARGIQSVILDATDPWEQSLHLDWDSYFLSSIGRPKCLSGVHYCANNRFEDFEMLVGKLHEANSQNVGVIFDGKNTDICMNRSFAHGDAQYMGYPMLVVDLELDPFTLFAQVGDWIRKHQIDGVIGNSRSVLSMLKDEQFFEQEVKNFVSTNVLPTDTDIAGIDLRYEVLGETAVEIVHRQYVNNDEGLSDETIGSLIDGKWKDGLSYSIHIPTGQKEKLAF